MRYDKYKNDIFYADDLKRVELKIQQDIKKQQQDLLDFISEGEKRISEVEIMDKEKKFVCLGHTFKDGSKKSILLIIRYKDGTQRDERYSFSSISDMRKKLLELKEKYFDVDWNGFDEEI